MDMIEPVEAMRRLAAIGHTGQCHKRSGAPYINHPRDVVERLRSWGFCEGNGSIMRFAPSYLIARAMGRPEIIHEVSDLTHSSRRVRQVCDEFAAVLDEHMSGNRTTRGPGEELDRGKVNNSGWAVSTLEAALWAFNTTKSFEEGLIKAVNLGGDSHH